MALRELLLLKLGEDGVQELVMALERIGAGSDVLLKDVVTQRGQQTPIPPSALLDDAFAPAPARRGHKGKVSALPNDAHAPARRGHKKKVSALSNDGHAPAHPDHKEDVFITTDQI
jgi:hypothetical protein